MRLLAITPEYPPHAAGGILKYYELMAAAWTAAGARVTVLVASPFSSFDGYCHDGVDVRFISLEAVNNQAHRLTHLAAAPTYRRWIAAALAAADWLRTNADAFDAVETTDFGLLFAPLVGLASRPPLVVKLHGSIGQISGHEPPVATTALDSALARVTEAAVLPAADAMQAYSPANAAEWSTRLMHDVQFLPAPLPLPAAFGSVQPSDYAAVVVGRVQTWKGPELLCRAFMELGADAPPDLTVAWVGRDTATAPGGGSMSSWLAASYPGIWGRRIVPIGPRTPAEVAALQRSSRFVVVPSAWDTFNYTLAEAMALESVVLGSTGAGASYLIDHGRTGFRFAPDDPGALAQLMLDAHAMPAADRRAIGAEARQTVADRLDASAAATASLTAFEALKSAPRAPLPSPWIREFFESIPDAGTELGHLENVSIRTLASHLKTRVARRIVG